MTRRRRAGRSAGWGGGKWIRPEKRVAIYARDGFRCVWCTSAHQLSLDHLHPCERGAWDNREQNLVTSCASCNRRRQALTILPWLRRLIEEWIDPRDVLARLRHARATPIDREQGRRLLSDDRVRSMRESADYRQVGRAA